jgi:thymidylate synthase
MDKIWHGLMREAINNGETRADRTGVGTRAVFGRQVQFDLRNGFPAVTTKRLPFRAVVGELSAFLAGCDRLSDFQERGCNFWDGNAKAPSWVARVGEGSVGRVYGVQWRGWRSAMPAGPVVEMVTVDQIASLIEGLRKDPHGRRHIVSAWNPGELSQMCLPPCHTWFQCFASDERGSWLDLQFYMRSLDLFLGAPCDIATYALMAHLLARDTGRFARRLIMTVGDMHVYNNHWEQVEEVERRAPFGLPHLRFARTGTSALDFRPGDVELVGYKSHESVPAPLNV